MCSCTAHGAHASQLARPLINEQANKHAQPPNIAPSGLTARFTNGPVTPPATDQHRPRKRGRRQAGRRRQWERGVAREIAVAPRRRALSLSLCVAEVGGGATRHRRPAPRWFDVRKAYQSQSCGLVPPLCSPLGHDQDYKRIFGQRSTKTNVAPRPPPSSWGLDGCWEGARRHEALIAQFVRTARFIVTYQP